MTIANLGGGLDLPLFQTLIAVSRKVVCRCHTKFRLGSLEFRIQVNEIVTMSTQSDPPSTEFRCAITVGVVKCGYKGSYLNGGTSGVEEGSPASRMGFSVAGGAFGDSMAGEGGRMNRSSSWLSIQ